MEQRTIINSNCCMGMQKQSGVYCILNTITNKFYIGSVITSNKGNCFRRRWLKHLADLRNNNHVNQHLQYSYNKYGKDSFTMIILEVVEDQNLIHEREQYWMDITNCTNEDIGYNKYPKAICVNKDYIASKETKQKLHNHFKNKSRPEWMKYAYGKAILQFTKEGEFIKEYYSMTEAAKAVGMHRTNIGDVARGKYKSCGGYIWKYKTI